MVEMEPYTRRILEERPASARPWTPEGQLLLSEAFELFGKALLPDAWTGEEHLARNFVLGPPQAPKRPYTPTQCGETPEGVLRQKQQTVSYVVEGRRVRLTYEEAVERFEAEREELERLWKEERSALQRYKTARNEFRKVLYSKVVSACILTEYGSKHALPIESWAQGSVWKVFRSEKARLAVKRGDLLEGIVLIPEQELMSHIEAHFMTKVAEGIVVEHPPEGTITDAKAMSSPRSGGRPPKWDWEACWLQICVSIHDEGLPDTQAELVRKLQSWFLESTGEEPSDSSIRERTTKVFKALGPSENS